MPCFKYFPLEKVPFTLQSPVWEISSRLVLLGMKACGILFFNSCFVLDILIVLYNSELVNLLLFLRKLIHPSSLWSLWKCLSSTYVQDHKILGVLRTILLLILFLRSPLPLVMRLNSFYYFSNTRNGTRNTVDFYDGFSAIFSRKNIEDSFL